MKNNTYQLISAGFICVFLASPVLAGSPAEPPLSTNGLLGEPLKVQSAEWWQYIFSIPTPVNPILDAEGKNCVVGQHGPIWFLAGAFNGQGTVERTCTIPEGKWLFFPALNYFFVDTPGVCGQVDSVPVDDMRDLIKACLDGAGTVSVTVDGSAVKNLPRVKSVIFEATFPKDNIFNTLCGDYGGLPGRTYSPAVDEGYYVVLKPLSIGKHTINITATAPECAIAGPVSQDVTYDIIIVQTPGIK